MVGEGYPFMNTQLSLGVAFIAGLASFLSPCVLPLVPIYLAQLAGPSVYQAGQVSHDFYARLTTFLHALLFVAGFTLAFVSLGATASTLGAFLFNHIRLLRQIGGIILIVMGLHLTGLLRLHFLYQHKGFTFQPRRPAYPASFLFGLIFALAWTPCVGPILSSIFLLATNTNTLQQGVILLLAYSLGLGLPFLLLGLGLNQLSTLLKKLRPYLGKIEIATGIVMIVAGVLVFFNLLVFVNQYFNISLFNL